MYATNVIKFILCGENNEDLVHFVVDCVVLQSERDKILKLQRLQEENREKLEKK